MRQGLWKIRTQERVIIMFKSLQKGLAGEVENPTILSEGGKAKCLMPREISLGTKGHCCWVYKKSNCKSSPLPLTVSPWFHS